MKKDGTYLIVVSAPSGAGKTTLCSRLLADFPSIKLSISSTTRAPRGTERHGSEYFFLSREDFEKGIRENVFVEWALVHGNYYGTSAKVIDDFFAQGLSVLLDIDVQGAEQLRNRYPENCFTVFISPPNLEELEARLRSRGTDSEETIQKRLKNAQQEMAESSKFHAVVVNDSLDRAYAELKILLETRLRLTSKVKNA